VGSPIVALESTVITHGLPSPENIKLAQDMETEVRQGGAVPATIAVLEGKIHVGLTNEQFELLAGSPGLRKASPRDFARMLINAESGGTTVAGTLFIAHMVGINVFATGGIGGVHRQPAGDVSADLPQLAQTPGVVVCSGAKAILDIPATVEYLETHGVPVIGYQTGEFPAFYSADSGLPTSIQVDSVKEILEIAGAHWGLGLRSALLVANPPPAEVALAEEEVRGAIEQALAEAKREKIQGQDVTPFLLKRVSELTGDMSLQANLGLLINNARLAAKIAYGMSDKRHEQSL
jgi:pseudouridine-5'-phosphate glycosidase